MLVAGGAGAVGHAAVQLACWAGARVVATVSSSAKAHLALAAKAHEVIDYTSDDAAGQVLAAIPGGAEIIVEVNPVVNAELDQAVLAPNGTVASYSSVPRELHLDVRRYERKNARHQFVMVFGMPEAAKLRAVEEVSAALAAGALSVGEEHGLPLHCFPLEETVAAHAAGEAGAVGKVLVCID